VPRRDRGVIGAPVAGGCSHNTRVRFGGFAQYRHATLQAERVLDGAAVRLSIGVAQQRHLLVNVGQARLGVTGEPEGAAGERQHDREKKRRKR
jgi:hypothetical protein